jgi:hypothetical protein
VRDWNSPGTRRARAERNRAHTHIKMAPHRTVPEGRGPRLSRHVRPHVVFRPENPTSANSPIPQVAPSRARQYVVSRRYDTALRETSEAIVPGVRAARHTCSALLAEAARGYHSVRRLAQASPATATGDMPRTRELCRRQLMSGAGPGRSLCCPADEVVPSCGAQKARSRDGRRTHSTEPTLT